MVGRLSSIPWYYKVLVGVILGLGLVLAGYFWGEGAGVQAEVVSAAPAARQMDGSLVVARQAIAAADLSPAPHVLPVGSKEERRMQVKVRPKPKVPAGGLSLVEPCDDVTVDMSLVRDAFGGRRLVASALGGEVVQGFDMPVEQRAGYGEPRRWAAGVLYQPKREGYGVIVTRDVDRFRFGALLLKPPGKTLEPWLTAQFAW